MQEDRHTTENLAGRQGRATPRKMTGILMRLTVVLTVSLGVLAGGFQMLVDLKQEKDAVEINASELVDSLAPTAAKALYDFDDRGARQVAEGLFTQRAIGRVVIWENDEVYMELARDLSPTLPNIGAITTSDVVALSRNLYNPAPSADAEIIGRLEVIVDRSMVPPAIVDRMFMYFVIAVLKNFALGALLIIVVFRGLARHIIRLAKVVDQWTPASGAILKPEPPRYLRHTELDILGSKIVGLAANASDAVRSLEISNEQINIANTELRGHSDDLSNALQERNDRLRVLNQELVEIANRDSLTSLYNRRYFEQMAAEIWDARQANGGNAIVTLIDIDFFKAYNDFYGHQQGDDCLRQVAQALRAYFDAAGGLFARYGGEEFIALLPGAEAGEVEAIAQRIVDHVADLQIEHARSLNSNYVSISVGVACRQRTAGLSLQDFIGAADRALYAAKAGGRGRYHIATEDLITAVQREEETTQRILDGMRTRAFEPFYQPQFDARTGRLIGVEVLARWRQADGAFLSPAAFLPRAEALGLDAGIDAIIQEKALEQLRVWTREGIAPDRFSMNMSENRLLSGEIQRLVERFADVDSERLAFELLEHIFVEQQSTAFQMRIDQLRECGVAVEIDDFGTGHTSLTSLATIAPERIKIARELVTPLGVDARGTKVVEAVVEMAQAFRIDLIAEGVETKRQSDLLIAMNCPIQQGYYFARPAPADEVEEMLRQNAATNAAVA